MVDAWFRLLVHVVRYMLVHGWLHLFMVQVDYKLRYKLRYRLITG
jgi:hypothetical protein